MARSEWLAQAAKIAKSTLTHAIGTPVSREALSSTRDFTHVLGRAVDTERQGAAMYHLAARGWDFPAGMQIRDRVGRLETGMEELYQNIGTPQVGKRRIFRGFRPKSPYFGEAPAYSKAMSDLHRDADWFIEDPNVASAYAGNTNRFFSGALPAHPEAPEAIRARGLPADERGWVESLRNMGGIRVADVGNDIVENALGRSPISGELALFGDESKGAFNLAATRGVRAAATSVEANVYENLANSREARAAHLEGLWGRGTRREADSRGMTNDDLRQYYAKKRAGKSRYRRRGVTPVMVSNPSSGRMGGVPSQKGRGGAIAGI